MKLINESMLLGLGVGVALTLLGLDLCGRQYRQQLYFATTPAVLRPFTQQAVPGLLPSSDRLPKPWIPNSSSGAHDHWQVLPQDGKPVELGSFKGKTVFLDFWATYCGPCVAELPGIGRLARSLSNDNVVFLVVSREKPEQVREFQSKNHFALPFCLADKEPPIDLPADGLPTTYILDRSGNAVYREVGAANWDTDSARAFLQTLAAK